MSKPPSYFQMLHQTFQISFLWLSPRRSISDPTPRSRSSSPINRQSSTRTPSSSELTILQQRDQSPPSTPAQVSCLPTAETTIGWKYANHGSSILATAVKESQHGDTRNQAFTRQLYIHALSYLLQGLPDNLSSAEVSTLQNAIPDSLQQDLPQHRKRSCLSQQDTEPSLLHRILASWIIKLFLFLHFIIPYLTLFLTKAYDYERTNHVSERFLASSLSVADTVRNTCISMLRVILVSGNGRIGEILVGGLAWWVEGISGGLHQGIKEGMEIMGARKAQNS